MKLLDEYLEFVYEALSSFIIINYWTGLRFIKIDNQISIGFYLWQKTKAAMSAKTAARILVSGLGSARTVVSGIP